MDVAMIDSEPVRGAGPAADAAPGAPSGFASMLAAAGANENPGSAQDPTAETPLQAAEPPSVDTDALAPMPTTAMSAAPPMSMPPVSIRPDDAPAFSAAPPAPEGVRRPLDANPAVDGLVASRIATTMSQGAPVAHAEIDQSNLPSTADRSASSASTATTTGPITPPLLGMLLPSLRPGAVGFSPLGTAAFGPIVDADTLDASAVASLPDSAASDDSCGTTSNAPSTPSTPVGHHASVGFGVGASTPSAQALPRAIASAVGSGDWADELGARLSWMIGRGEQLASVALNPEALGPLEIRVAVREGEASVWFTAAAPETRAALEQALPRLRDMLAGAGLALAHSGVSAEGSRDPWRVLSQPPRDGSPVSEGTADALTDDVGSRASRGLIDLYA